MESTPVPLVSLHHVFQQVNLLCCRDHAVLRCPWPLSVEQEASNFLVHFHSLERLDCWPSVDVTPPWSVVRRTDNYETRNPVSSLIRYHLDSSMMFSLRSKMSPILISDASMVPVELPPIPTKSMLANQSPFTPIMSFTI